jgi:ParB-like chromosome segregation protein Spo0J
MSEAAPATLTLDGDCLVVQVPLQIKRRRGRKEIIAPAGLDAANADQTRTNRGLAVMVARAHRWQELLESGRYTSIRELALDVGVDNSYLARVLRLTLLAPDLIEAILDGTEPDGLSLEKLYRLPVEWEEQRRAVGTCEQIASTTPMRAAR